MQKQSNIPQQTLPQDRDTELDVLGTIINNDGYFSKVEDILNSDAFYDNILKGIFRCVKYLLINNKIADTTAIIDTSKRFAGKLDATINDYDVMEVIARDCKETFIQDVERIVEYGQRRKAWEILTKAQQRILSLSDDATETMTSTISKIDDIKVMSVVDSDVVDAMGGLRVIHNQINDNINGINKSSINTGFTFTDAKGGLRTGTLVVVGAFTSVGKALPMNANILTPNGWVKNKDLFIGQQISSIDGKPSYVTNIFKRGVRDMYNVTFNDGRVVKCCGEHLWEVNYPNWKTPHILNTLEIKRLQEGVSYKNRMSVPAFSGIYGEYTNFLIHPYILGVLLGDGCLTQNTVTWCKPDMFIKEKIKCLLKVTNFSVTEKGDCSFSITTKRGEGNPILEELRKLGLKGLLSCDKFIPKIYLNACREQRIQLLNGMMDTDGYSSKDGQCVYYTTSKRLADDFLYLCHSLGYRASIKGKIPTLKGKKYRKLYIITICSLNDEELFSLPRKKERTKKRKRCNIVIRSIEYVGQEECQCITVSHERQLYITDGFIVTHNTTLALNMALNVAKQKIPVACYSLEMSVADLWSRIICEHTGIPAWKIQGYALKREEIAQIDHATRQLQNIPLYIDDKATTSFERMLRSVRFMVKRYGIKMFVVDYLQIFAQTTRGEKEEAMLASMARACKNISMELDIVCILLSQLRRAGESKHPTFDMLRGSGQIEESADNIILIDRPDAHPDWGVTSFKNNKTIDVHGKAEINVVKGRNIGTGCYYVNFDDSRFVFYEDNQQAEQTNTNEIEDPIEPTGEQVPF